MPDSSASNLLEEIEFRDTQRAKSALAALEQLPQDVFRVVQALLHSLPNRDDAVHYLKRLITEAPDAAQAITGNVIALRYAMHVFSWSRFLSESIINHPEWLMGIADARDLHRGFLAEDYEVALERALGEAAPRPVDLAMFRRRQLLRIVLRDVLRYADLSETAEDLSNLADAILNVTWAAVRRELTRERGAPLDSNGTAPEFSVIALGKLGGRELNYSSDIDLMFVHSGGGQTGGSQSLTSTEFFKIAAGRMTEVLSTYSPEGLCYRVDLRLRPDGRLGEISQSLESMRQYYTTRARAWELQMLIKARVAAGDARPGAELLEFVEPLIYQTTTDFRTVEAVSETRARIHEKQSKATRARLENARVRQARPPAEEALDVKLAKGGIRDIEFLVQCLQRLHGGREAWVRHGGTLLALSRLRDKDLLSPAEYSRLANAYQFLRHVEHRLQFDEDRQTHTLPVDKEDVDLLARKMPPGMPGLPTAGTLQRELDHHFTNVQDLYDRVIHSHRPEAFQLPYSTSWEHTEPQLSIPFHEDAPARAEFPSVNLSRFLEQRAPSFRQWIASAGIVRSQDSFESFLEKVVANPEWLALLDSNEDVAKCAIDLFEHSQYFADQLVRHPALLREIDVACSERQGRTGFSAPRDASLRRYFRQQMMRIQADSVYHAVPVFRTLQRTSDLADSVVAAAYDVALEEALATAPPADPQYKPARQMRVIALGRLGTREFDLASDADLNFVIPDEDASETLFWTTVAERIISVIGSYTGDGVVFTIDTRLRPNGREGALVQTEGAYRKYFAHKAQAWEGLSYMKARAIAGDIEKGTAFLVELQEIDWKRYGQARRSREELAHMRRRLEKEQGVRNPLKAGVGGYYDIDFALMYLRLRDAGSFYKALNTPRRIEVIVRAGGLSAADAGFLSDAATMFRAIDHGLRVATGHAEGRLPTNPTQVAVMTELVHRWVPPALRQGSVESVMKKIRRETRAFFERIFTGE
ncbi:MAG TPA: glutamine-synthetase adenylyltransferase [Bryobacteraceae bacterium]|nr:glutamine-synthetase adenylyltransferase [Bryobacteraceae bacterium]